MFESFTKKYDYSKWEPNLVKLTLLVGVFLMLTGIFGIGYMQYFYANAKTTTGNVAGTFYDGYVPAGYLGGRNSFNLKYILNPRILIEKLTIYSTDGFMFPQIQALDTAGNKFAFDAAPLSTTNKDSWPTGKEVTVYFNESDPVNTARIRNYDYEWLTPLDYLVGGMLLIGISYVMKRVWKV